METTTVEFAAAELTRIGMVRNSQLIGLEFASADPTHRPLSITLPAAELALLVARATSGLASATRAAGGPDGVHALRCTAAMVTSTPQDQAAEIALSLGEDAGAVVPVLMTREAALALFSGLGDLLAS